MIKHLLKKAMLLQFFLLFSCILFAQQKTVTGKIIDVDGKPIPGVTVSIKGSTVSTATDDNGVFSIVVPANESVLKFSSATFLYQEVTVGAKTTLYITLQRDAKQIDEVVVIGYGQQKARAVTGAVSSVNLKKLEDLPVASITEMLRGQVPNLNVNGGSTRPGAFATVTIRQQFALGKDNGGPTPIIVIDDVIQLDATVNPNAPSMDRLNQLDLSEIESITVLRDASAAIYGARGSQGAIVVKTKRGKAGAPRLTYSGKFETNDAVSHSKVMNAQEYGIFSNRLNRQNASANQNVFFTPTEIAMMDTINYDWLKNDWRSAQSMQHSLNVSGGHDRATYFVGGSYFKQGANLGEQDYNRLTFRAGTEVKFNGGFKFAASLSGANTSLEKSFTKVSFTDGYSVGGEQNDYNVLLHMPKYVPWIYPVNGVMTYIAPPLGPSKPGAATGNSALNQYNYYNLLDNGSKTFNKQYNLNTNVSLTYEVPFVKGLSFRGNYSIQTTSGNSEQDMFAQFFSQLNNTTLTANQTANPQTYHLYTPTTVFGTPFLNRNNTRVTYDKNVSTIEQLNFYANYDRSFGDHSIGAVFVGERGKTTFDDEFLIYDNPVPGVYNGTSISAGTLNTSNSFTNKSVAGNMSYIGRLNYSFKNRYFLQGSFRSDASSHFAPENYWGFFPGVSAGWIISDEPFFNTKSINFLKLRGGLSKTGMDNIKAWKWLQLYDAATDKGMSFGSGGGLFTVGLTPGVTPNRNVKWDQTIQRNVGVDITLLKNRLSLSVDQYLNTTKDALTVLSGLNVPVSVGGAFAEENYSNIKWWGTELSATWNDFIGKVSYSIGVNYSMNGNEYLKVPEQPFNYPSVYAGKAIIGGSTIGPVYGYRTWKGTSSGDGMLRTDADLDGYWAYLTDLATKAGTTPLYNAGGAGISTRAGLKKGMLAYEDAAGNLNTTTNTIAGQNGQIVDDQDYVKLAKSSRSYGFATNLRVGYKSFNLLAQISTSWGGYNSLDRVKQGTASTNASWSQVSYLTDMYDSTDNPNGKYPNMFYYDNAYKQSDFWTISSFRCVVRSLSIGYTLPKAWLNKAKIGDAKLVLSGYNLWDLFNPYPNKYRNMYDAPNVGYPTLRTWALGVNVGF
jgi:TonB-linked SusC/RagA family outer membrane protein